MRELLVYLAVVPVFFGIDMIWIGLIADGLYKQNIPGLAKSPNWFAAIMFYLIYIVGILVFAVWPNLGKNWTSALFYGALFGFFAYATYDLTNYAVMTDWPLSITLIDLAWGTFLTASVSVIAYFIATKFII